MTERDSLYGRSIHRLFEGARIGDLFDAAEIRDVFPAAKIDSKFLDAKVPGVVLHEFTYLRGADGAVANADGTASDATKSGSAAGRSAGAEPPRGTRPIGLLAAIGIAVGRVERAAPARWRGRNPGDWRGGDGFLRQAAGAAGMRKSFPRAWFFTTDLDAGFWHPEEYDNARNLLVASHFGLSLQRDLQGSVAPFRDSYQTATFFAALLALTIQPPAKSGEQGGRKPWGRWTKPIPGG